MSAGHRFLIGLHALLILTMAFSFARVLFWREPDEFTGLLAVMYPVAAFNLFGAICRLAKDSRRRRSTAEWLNRMENIDQDAAELLAKVEERKRRRDQKAGK